MKNTYSRISRNINPLKKWWIEKTVDKNNNIISTGSFNDDLYERYKSVVNAPICKSIR